MTTYRDPSLPAPEPWPPEQAFIARMREIPADARARIADAISDLGVAALKRDRSRGLGLIDAAAIIRRAD